MFWQLLTINKKRLLHQFKTIAIAYCRRFRVHDSMVNDFHFVNACIPNFLPLAYHASAMIGPVVIQGMSWAALGFSGATRACTHGILSLQPLFAGTVF